MRYEVIFSGKVMQYRRFSSGVDVYAGAGKLSTLGLKRWIAKEGRL